MFRLLMLITLAVLANFLYAETIVELNGSLQGERQSIIVTVPMSLWDESAELEFEIKNPSASRGAVSFEFQDPILNMLNKLDSDRFDIALVGVEHGSDAGTVKLTVSFDASEFVRDHELNMKKIGAASQDLRNCPSPHVKSEWSPSATTVDAGLAFTQSAVIGCGPAADSPEYAVLVRVATGTK